MKNIIMKNFIRNLSKIRHFRKNFEQNKKISSEFRVKMTVHVKKWKIKIRIFRRKTYI